jgi:hypothetical protein
VPFSRRQVFDAAITSLNTISLAVVDDNEPFVRTVLCRTVANTLSAISSRVRRMARAGYSASAATAKIGGWGSANIPPSRWAIHTGTGNP